MTRTDWLVTGLLVFQGMLAAAVIKPEGLGLPAVAIAWMAVLNIGCGILLNQLKALGTRPRHVPPQKGSDEGHKLGG